MGETALRIDGMEDLDDARVCYWKTSIGWMVYLPGYGVSPLLNHQVAEHEDGTISVAPSIRADGHRQGKPLQRHGDLTKGVWEECKE